MSWWIGVHRLPNSWRQANRIVKYQFYSFGSIYCLFFVNSHVIHTCTFTFPSLNILLVYCNQICFPCILRSKCSLQNEVYWFLLQSHFFLSLSCPTLRILPVRAISNELQAMCYNLFNLSWFSWVYYGIFIGIKQIFSGRLFKC